MTRRRTTMMMMMMPSPSSYFGVVLLLLILVVLQTVSKYQYYSGTTVVVDAFSPSFTRTIVRRRLLGSMDSSSSSSSRKADGDTTRLHMVKATKNKKKKKATGGVGGGSGGGLKGFGSPTVVASSSSSSTKVEVDRSKETRAFYDFLEQQGAGSNLNRCALGNFQLTAEFKLRGVVALRQIKKGDDIINIPYDCAINLGQEGSDPTIPALKLLKDYCATLSSSSSSSQQTDGSARRAAYYRMLPPFEGDDCMGSTDFFSDQALEALQSPLIKEETLNRRQLVKTRFEQAEFGESEASSSGSTPDGTISWIDGTPLTERHLLWAVWLITSRVLTVQGQEGTGQSFRLLIPFLDMCNHDRSSTHILTGRAVPGGELKVVAGSKVSEGDPINIVYGGGNAGNNRFIQDYGFIDTTRSGSSKKLLMKDSSDGDNDDDDNNVAAAFTMVAQELVGKRRAVEGASANRYLSQTDRTRSLEALSETSIEDDERLLADETDPSLTAAYTYRIGVKRALSKLGAFDDS